MIFTIIDDSFITNDSFLDSWTKIWIESKERHFFYIDQNAYDIISNSDWYSRLSTINKEFFDLQFIESNNFKKSQIQLIISESDDEHYTLIESVEILLKSVSLILENIEYDAYFLQAVFRLFKDECKKINKHLNEGWLIYENGGGNNIINVINQKKSRFVDLDHFAKEPKTYLRTFVIIDSDKKFPSENEVDVEKQPLLDFISEFSEYHVTRKREMENYLPDKTIEEIPNNEKFKEAILSLSSVQRDFIDLEKGLQDKNLDQFEPLSLRELFIDLNVDSKKNIVSVLRKEKLEFKKENGKSDSFKARFSKLFMEESVTKDGLRKRDNSNELELIIKKINDLL